MNMKRSPVVHFEMGYNDRDRMCTFYEAVFGWGMQNMGPEMGDYVIAQTTETDESGMVQRPGTINGGFYQKTSDPSSHAPSVVVAVEDVHAAMKAIEENGGKILGAMDSSGNLSMEPQEIPGVGLWISAMDTEGNRISVLQPREMQ